MDEDNKVDKCPTCERDFNEMKDYPLIYFSKFERKGSSFPEDAKFPVSDYTIFVGPKAKSSNAYPPQEVLDFFRDNKEEIEYVHEGWTWGLENRSGKPRPGVMEVIIKGIKNKVKKKKLKEEDWEIGDYWRHNEDAKDIILKHVNPYLDKLEGLVGKELTINEMFPDFLRDSMFQYTFAIPGINDYYLLLDEGEKINARSRIAKVRLFGKDINLGSAGGPTIQELAELATIEYEGRLKGMYAEKSAE